MFDPYRMVAISSIASILLATIVLFYKFIFPKKKISLLALLILISILPIISVFRTGAYESGDFNIHIYRSVEFYKSISESNFLPSWAENLNATYGYPLFIFNYTLPYYIISFFHTIGASFIGSLKIFLVINVILSGVFMFLYTKKIFKNELCAYISSVFYLFVPYHLVDVHFKVVIGEILFFTVLPLAFLFLERLKNKNTLINILFFSLVFTALILSHLAIALFTAILMLFYVLFNLPKKNLKNAFLCVLIGFVISSLISLYQWLGPIILSKYSFLQNTTLIVPYFPTLIDMLYSPWRMGLLFQGPRGEISHLVGYAQLIVIFCTLFVLKKLPYRRTTQNLLFWLTAFFIIIFFITPYSRKIWELLPTIKYVGSHRLFVLTSFTSSIIAGFLPLIFKKKIIIYFFILIAIFSTILNWGQRRVIPEINDVILKNNIPQSTSQGEAHFYANSKWADVKNPWFSVVPKKHIEIIDGLGEVKEIFRTSTKHAYLIDAKSELKIQENTLYFPGWQAKINNYKILIFPSNKGVIQANIPKGKYMITFDYQDIFIYRILKIISITAFLIVSILLTSKLIAKLKK